MESSDHSRNSSSDAGEQDVKFRDCDDMLSRRLGANIPAPLRKKKEESYKRFLTPTGNPMVYVKQHMRSKSLSDIQVENAAKEQERDERNVRYEEMEKLKEMLKEEEETWSSNLDNWKQRRRSVTLDARKRKEVRDSVEQQTSVTTHRRAKTYKEMVEEKKRRESGSAMFPDDDNSDIWRSLPSESTSHDTRASNSQQTNKKYPYRGALSVPDLAAARNTRAFARSPSPPATKAVAERVTYTSKVTAVINHNPSKSNESSDFEKVDASQVSEPKNTNRNRIVTRIGSSWPPQQADVPANKAHVPTNQTHVPENRAHVPANREHVSTIRAHVPDNRARVPANRASVPVSTSPISTTNSRPSYNPNPVYKRSQSPPAVSQSSKNSVQMRHSSSRQIKERPKSAYGSIGRDRAATLPRNYHSYSAPKTPDPNTSDFIQNRKSAFANKRSMWENMGHEKQKSAPAAPQHLASLLKHDTERLYGGEHPDDSKNMDPTPYRRASSSYESSETSSPRENGFQEDQPDYKPKILGVSRTNKANDANNLRPWQGTDIETNKPDAKSIHKHVATPMTRAPWVKSATLPSKARISLYDYVDSSDTAKPIQQEISPRQNGLEQDPKPSPRSPISDITTQFDEMKICINQRPKSEKGFGFTVRGGDDGKPVIVHSVSAGGAADICQLCVSDEILAINDVRLTSSLTQDGIVKLIVDSVMTGNLSLDIKRYGKSKKPNPLRLSGTKVVMTSGGFVQVRSDKGKAPVVSTKSFNGNLSNANEQEKPPIRQETPPLHDLPLPPPPENLEPPKRLSAMDRLSPKKPPSNSYKRASPLSNLINSAKSTSPRSQDNGLVKGKENDRLKSPSITTSPKEYDDQLEHDVLKAQQDLAVEESYLQHEKRQHEENINLRKQLLEEQRSLEEREVKREEEKRRRIEEAKAEELRLEQELRKIEAAKLEQQKRREEEKRKLMDSQSGFDPTFNHGELNHWLIEEAERSRLAEDEGRRRANVFEYNNTNNGQNSQAPQIPGSLANYWNDPNTRATLL